MGQTPSKYDEKPELGDLIQIFRSYYQHWAVYVGDGFIVHLTSLPGVLGASASSLAIVKKEKLEDVVGTDRWKINNSLDEKYKPRLVQDIVREALAKVGKKLPYNVLKANCEHFANELRYGKAESWQAQVGEIVMGAGAAVVCTLFPVGALLAVSASVSASVVSHGSLGPSKKDTVPLNAPEF